ncbi:hypothetical protein NDU88_001329 [Pleurodeles waltl]|uniref:Uncharacterized protein n=1 Tax=Pleurodeles waltl TaxID=8319 RepID=A0AAV7UWI1_PLEWA|nr:hypothetical protein NDU88_001329 [Pleurodeles waltl]
MPRLGVPASAELTTSRSLTALRPQAIRPDPRSSGTAPPRAAAGGPLSAPTGFRAARALVRLPAVQRSSSVLSCGDG